jgi:hypothetical protein
LKERGLAAIHGHNAIHAAFALAKVLWHTGKGATSKHEQED